ncbi:MAG: hypothetical protein R3346_02555 [Candidatus Spechtbacterales bacterium]|nr:hypothetical protein [Candidatus Spechtbacterales bacterium]
MRKVVVASHNTMFMSNRDILLRYYGEIQQEHGLDILCLQESVLQKEDPKHTEFVAEFLGPGYRFYYRNAFLSPAIIYDSHKFQPIQSFSIPIGKPDMRDVPIVLRWLAVSDPPIERFTTCVMLEDASGRIFTVVNFHLSPLGSNLFCFKQLRRIKSFLAAYGIRSNIVFAGDTNIFHLRPRTQRMRLAQALMYLGVRDPDFYRPTHFFSRFSASDRWYYKIPRILGLDLAQRLDVIASDMPFSEFGAISIPESDHDLVWGKLKVH